MDLRIVIVMRKFPFYSMCSFNYEFPIVLFYSTWFSIYRFFVLNRLSDNHSYVPRIWVGSWIFFFLFIFNNHTEHN